MTEACLSKPHRAESLSIASLPHFVCRAPLAGLLVLLSALGNARAELRIEVLPSAAGSSLNVVDGVTPVFGPIEPGSALVVALPEGRSPVRYKKVERRNDVLACRGGTAPGLAIEETFRTLHPKLIERTVTVTAQSDERYFLDLGWKAIENGPFHSFLGSEKATTSYSPGCGGPEFGKHSLQTFPMAGYRHGDTFYGLIGDTPGLW